MKKWVVIATSLAAVLLVAKISLYAISQIKGKCDFHLARVTSTKDTLHSDVALRGHPALGSYANFQDFLLRPVVSRELFLR